MNKPYYILVGRDAGHPWGVLFGDHDHSAVVFERLTYRDDGWKARHLKILKCPNARKASVEKVVADLNADTQ